VHNTVGRFHELATSLHQQTVEIIAPKTCKQPDWLGAKFDEKLMICAGHAESGKRACYGDGGGPLQCLNSDGRWSLVGLAGWGMCVAKLRNRQSIPMSPQCWAGSSRTFQVYAYIVCRLYGITTS